MRPTILLCLCLLLPALKAAAQETALTAEHTYILGDGETMNDARQKAFLEAKRKLLEKAGTYSEVRSAAKDFVMESDAVQSFAAAFVKTEIVRDEVSVVGRSPAVTIGVEAKIDLGEVKRTLERLAQTRSQDPAARTGALTLDPPSGPIGPNASLERRLAEKERIRRDLAGRETSAHLLPEKGFSRSEVARLLGTPDLTKYARIDAASYQCDAYGRLWVIFRDERVLCLRNRLAFDRDLDSDCHCEGLSTDFVLR